MSNELLLATVYRRAAVTFLLLTITLLALVLYVVLPKALIVVTPSTMEFEKQLFFTVAPQTQEDESDFLKGLEILSDITLEQSFKASGVQETTESLTGTVTIINNYSKSQPLVRTTRLLTEDGVLLRLSEGVTVPVGGNVEARVYLDEDTKQVAKILPGRLTIPGLWEGIQDRIYAEVNNTITGEVVKSSLVTNDDVTMGQSVLRSKAEELASTELTEAFNASQIIPPRESQTWKLMASRITHEKWNIPNDLVGSSTVSFIVSGNFTLEGVFYDPEEVEMRIDQLLTADEVITDRVVLETETMLTNTELPKNSAEVMVVIKGEQKLDVKGFLETYDISGRSKADAKGYLTSQDEIETVEIELSPFWVKRIPKKKIELVILNK